MTNSLADRSEQRGAWGAVARAADVGVAMRWASRGWLTALGAMMALAMTSAACDEAGEAGAQGEQGPRGEAGPAGETGPQGVKGDPGDPGAQGPQGPRGEAGPQGPQGPAGPGSGADGRDAAVRTIALEAGEDCAAGGVRIETGVDADRSGTLDDEEVDPLATQVVCNGVAGAQGAQGPQGVKGDRGEQGEQGPQGMQGVAGMTGPQGIQGIQGVQGPPGAKGDKGDKGDRGDRGLQGIQGEQGPEGPPGEAVGGVQLLDANNVVIGQILELGAIIRVLTTTGHVLALQFDGTVPASQILYTGANCTGTAYLNAGGIFPFQTYGKGVVFSRAKNSLMRFANVDPNGSATSQTFTSATIDNPACGPSTGTQGGWLLATTTATAVGLPSYPVATPLKIE